MKIWLVGAALAFPLLAPTAHANKTESAPASARPPIWTIAFLSDAERLDPASLPRHIAVSAPDVPTTALPATDGHSVQANNFTNSPQPGSAGLFGLGLLLLAYLYHRSH